MTLTGIDHLAGRTPLLRLAAARVATMESCYTVLSVDDILDLNEYLDALHDAGAIS